jgi:hypothetical protein
MDLSRGLGDVYKRQYQYFTNTERWITTTAQPET